MEDGSGGLFNIDIDHSEEPIDETEKVPRDFQSEEAFQRMRREWKPKSETGELWNTLSLPIENPTKQEAQTILHAIEELYFFRRYEEAGKVADDALKERLNGDLRRTIWDYKERCEAKIIGLQAGKDRKALT